MTFPGLPPQRPWVQAALALSEGGFWRRLIDTAEQELSASGDLDPEIASLAREIRATLPGVHNLPPPPHSAAKRWMRDLTNRLSGATIAAWGNHGEGCTSTKSSWTGLSPL